MPKAKITLAKLNMVGRRSQPRPVPSPCCSRSPGDVTVTSSHEFERDLKDENKSDDSGYF